MKSASEAAVFGPFTLLLGSKQLLKDGVPVAMGGRALELLTVLIEQQGKVVGKQELLTRAWPNLFVEEANLRVQMAALRRILGDGQAGQRYIVNATRVGYSFIAPVRIVDLGEAERAFPPAPSAARENLPLAVTPAIGREAVVAAIRAELGRHRLVTLVGAGGVGKTTVAIEVARASLPDNGAVILVDFAQIADPAHVEQAVATAVGMTLGIAHWQMADPLPVAHGLIILDNCEHVIDTAAHAADLLLQKGVGVRVLATSREPLRTQGEYVLRLPGLDVPQNAADLDPERALALPAVRLFIDRAAAALGSYDPPPDEIAAIVALCRHLDGIPLAIELAAGRIDAFGVHGLAERLDNVLRLLVAGRRTALKRHQTLLATLNWSYDHLTPGEQVTLARLGTFVGHFSLEAAARVASFDEPSWDTIENLTNLVAKSLVSADFSQAVPRYRLLETTRAYALDKLRVRGEVGRLRRRHALYMKEAMQLAESEWARVPATAWVNTYAGQIDNLRLALDWCFGPEGDPELGAELTAVSAVLWFQLSLVDEARGLFERAMTALALRAQPDPVREVTLLCALGTALVYTVGPTPQARETLAHAWRIAQGADNIGLELRALWCVFLVELSSGHYPAALDIADRFTRLAEEEARFSTTSHVRTGHRLRGFAQYYLGDVRAARLSLEAALNDGGADSSAVVRMQFDQELNARAYHSQTLWLLGHQELALTIAAACVADARARGHATTLSLVLVESGCPVALHAGALDLLEERVDLLQELSGKLLFGPWSAWGQCFRGALLLARGDAPGAVDDLTEGLKQLARTGWPIRRAMFLGHLAQALHARGDGEAAQHRIEEAIALAQASREGWILPELLRVQAVLYEAARPADAVACIERARDLARRDGMEAWLARCNIVARRLGLP
ncbi:ATP-binding protein [Ancylobacter radicis]|uniref:Winged helix-turn-helix domain-containing protein n=1 Tax=Ancylobacter radicis TaxID=2836179 RepID=A0ABS5R5M0_9HYPH|nr:winged helix-turn-helix domain-containing protein [Ancylobacter radicis]MBS9476951.1 winged helix-turn-helix domain-containing protein [Ancylobacter radicis]